MMNENISAHNDVIRTMPPLETKGTLVPNHLAYLSDDFVIPPNHASGHFF